jgi:hypothetical protein
LGSRILILIIVLSRIRIILGSLIIRSKVKSQSRIHFKVNSPVRIRIKIKVKSREKWRLAMKPWRLSLDP